MKVSQPESVDQYLAAIECDDLRAAMNHVRSVLRDELPEATEVISYGMPAFRSTKVILCYGAFKSHCSLFPGTTLANFVEETKGFKTSKGTLQFTPDNPLPDSLIRAIAQARLAEIKASLPKRK